jgi:hypothetical protein
MALAVASAAPARGADASQVEINTSPEVPLRITNFRFDPSPAGMTAFRYEVQNVSGQGLVAVEVRWQEYFGEHQAVAFSNRDDRWLTGLLATDGSERFQVSNVPSLSAQAPPSRLVATITYAEFEDGTKLGSDAARVGREISQGRRATLTAYEKLLETFNSGGGEALAQALKQNSSPQGQDPAVQAGTARLLGILSDGGVDAVVEELQRVATMSVPEP